MQNEVNGAVATNYFLKPGFILFADEPTVISTVLGSCVSVCLFDRKMKAGGMNHFKYPYAPDKDKATACFGNASTFHLIRLMIHGGSKKRNLEAQIFGGANDPDITTQDIGQKNIKAAKDTLASEGVKVVSEDIAGSKGRKIVFNTQTNEIAILKVDKLRKGDWYPYEDER